MAEALRILVVDDNEADHFLVGELLDELPRHHERFEAFSLAQAQAIVEERAVDVILLDLGLPDSVGLDTVKGMCKVARSAAVVVLTGLPDEELALAAINAGAQDYLVKGSFSADVLRRTVRYAVERRSTELALRESETRFLTLIEQAADCMILHELDGQIIDVNPFACKTYGYSREELQAMTVADLDPDYEERAAGGDFWNNLAPNEPVMFEARQKTRSGMVLNVEVRLSMIEREGKKLILGLCRDITERRQSEREMARLVTAIDQAAESIVVTDARGIIQYVNPAFEAVTGYPRAEVLGQNPRLLNSGHHDEAFYQELWQTLAQGHSWSGVFVNRRKDGSLYTEEATISPVRDADGAIHHYVAVKRDISKERELEEQLRQSQRLEAIGQLAGGVAHDFNNLLTVILGQCDLLADELSDLDPLAASVDEIRQAGERASSLTRQLLAFSRRQILQPKEMDLNDTIIELQKMFRRLIGEHIELVTELTDEATPIVADHGQIEQVIVNLVVNARDAMPHGGTLTVATSVTKETFASVDEPATAQPCVRLTVTDTGTGIDEETQRHIFEPFFTTKEVGKGTGLGLSTVYGIVHQSGGTVRCSSTPGRGTTFDVWLPMATAVETSHSKASETSAATKGTETILVAEDEDGIRVIVKRGLERMGYQVLVAANGLEAERIAKTSEGPIDLLITDVVMAEMSGRELADRLVESNPDLSVLFISGYPGPAIEQHGVFEGKVHFLPKPFHLASLREQVRAILDEN